MGQLCPMQVYSAVSIYMQNWVPEFSKHAPFENNFTWVHEAAFKRSGNGCVFELRKFQIHTVLRSPPPPPPMTIPLVRTNMRKYQNRKISSILTASLPWCHFKTTNKSAKFEPLSFFLFFFAVAWEWIFIKKKKKKEQKKKKKKSKKKSIALKVDVLNKTHCLQACPCIFQPGNCTGWSSEGVKSSLSQSAPVWRVISICGGEKNKTKKHNKQTRKTTTIKPVPALRFAPHRKRYRWDGSV